jgi:hypothetical protein
MFGSVCWVGRAVTRREDWGWVLKLGVVEARGVLALFRWEMK